MAREDSGRRRSRGLLLDMVDSLTSLGLIVGGAVFILASGYLLYGILTGSLASLPSMSPVDRNRVMGNVLFACQAVSIGGIAVILSASARFYHEEVTGYILLIGGAILQWGVPMLVGPYLSQVSLEAARLPVFITGQFKIVGIVAIVAAVPFIVTDVWFKMRGVRRSEKPKGAVVIGKDKQDEAPKSRLYIFCWQMPYCREYLRKYCKAYEQRKSCWRIKSGCYCDEDMILRVMKTGKTGKLAGFDQRFSEVAGKAKSLTAAQKRGRCRACFLYGEHQKQKYRILSPLVFPLVVVVMWMYLGPAKEYLTRCLGIVDEIAGRVSYTPGTNRGIGHQWVNAPGTSEFVVWVFLICIGLVLVTYLLRGLEYAIFERQV